MEFNAYGRAAEFHQEQQTAEVESVFCALADNQFFCMKLRAIARNYLTIEIKERGLLWKIRLLFLKMVLWS